MKTITIRVLVMLDDSLKEEKWFLKEIKLCLMNLLRRVMASRLINWWLSEIDDQESVEDNEAEVRKQFGDEQLYSEDVDHDVQGVLIMKTIWNSMKHSKRTCLNSDISSPHSVTLYWLSSVDESKEKPAYFSWNTTMFYLLWYWTIFVSV